jgi:ABC-2 type transport system ATP-binding protein
VGPLPDLADVEGVHDVVQQGTRATFSVDAAQLNGVLSRLVALDVRSLTSSPPTLEEMFLRHYGDETGPSAPPTMEVAAS